VLLFQKRGSLNSKEEKIRRGVGNKRMNQSQLITQKQEKQVIKIGGTIVKSNFNMIKNSCNKYYAVGYTEMMVLPFVPLTMTFKDVRYYVDTPPVSLTTVQI
jgi:hypothetical protein